MAKLPEFKSKPIKGLEEKDWGSYTVKSITNRENGQYERTEEHRDRISQVHSGKTISAEHKQAWLSATPKTPWNKDVKLSQEHRENISEGLKGYGSLYKMTTPEGDIFIGYLYEFIEKFNCRDIAQYAKKEEPLKRGKFRGYLFQVYEEK